MLTVPKPLFPREGQRVLHSPIDLVRIFIHRWANDPADDGNALVGLWYAILIELGIALVVLLLLLWLF
jgi:hypothetical protein